MSNPIDNVPSTLANVLMPVERIDLADSRANFQFILNQYNFNAVITEKDAKYKDRYLVDIYEAGFLVDPTRTGITAHNLSLDEGFEVDDLIRVHILSDNSAIIISEQKIMLAQIVGSGPEGESDFTDGRYWGRLGYIANTGSDTEILNFSWYPVDGPFQSVVCITNFQDPNHEILSYGQICVVTYGFDRANPIKRRWFVVCAIGGVTGTSVRWGQVKWTGTELTQDSNSITYRNGLLISVGDTETTVIETPEEDCEVP